MMVIVKKHDASRAERAREEEICARVIYLFCQVVTKEEKRWIFFLETFVVSCFSSSSEKGRGLIKFEVGRR